MTVTTIEPATDSGTCPQHPSAGTLAKFHAPEIIFGPNSLAEVGFAARRLGARRPFVVSDPGVQEAGWVSELLGHLAGAGLRAVLHTDITPNPKDHEVTAAYQRYAETGCDLVIGMGGGSCIDAAKAVAILSANGGAIGDYSGVDNVVQPLPPLIMAPSTSGTGADVSQFCIITDTAARTKMTIIGRTLVPDLSVIDPRLLLTMPDWLNAATGLDALTHGIEAYVSRAHNPLTDVHAIHATRLVSGNLLATVETPEAPDPRAGMAQAALEAGLAFTNALLGATHAISHQVGGLLDAPHGLINGVLLPHIICFNAGREPERYGDLALALGLDVNPAGDLDGAQALAEYIAGLGRKLGVPSGLAGLGVGEQHLSALAEGATHDACLTTNPCPFSAAEIESVLRAAL